METMQKGQNFEFSQNILEHQCLIYSRDIKWYMIVYDYGVKKLKRGFDFGIFKMAAVTMETAKI